MRGVSAEPLMEWIYPTKHIGTISPAARRCQQPRKSAPEKRVTTRNFAVPVKIR